MLKFIVDTQLPPTLAVKLTHAGFDAVHTTHYLNGHFMNDKEIRKIAVDENRIIVTKDSDFFDHFILRGAPLRILLIELGNTSNPKLFSVMDANIIRMKNLFDTETTSLIVLYEQSIFAY